VNEPSLPEKIEAIDRRLARQRIEHAFGGALALAYYAEPRATDDIDINVFLTPNDFARIGAALRALGITANEQDERAARRDGQVRLWWGRNPIDIFLAYDELHEAMRQQKRMVPFGEERIPILAPEHLLACKALFDRPKDWLDIEQILLTVEELDAGEALRWVERGVGENDHRTMRLRELIQRDAQAYR
jgi:Nucleotidyl transferase AbiEii toxin, Type IV TA system